MESALIVCSSDKGIEFYSQLLRAAGVTELSGVKNGAQARRCFIDNDYDVVLVHTPLMDEYGTEAAVAAAERTSAGVLLVVKNEMADETAAKVEDDGVIVIGWPILKPVFHQALKIAAASRRRMLGLKSKNVQLQRQIEDMRAIDRAKCVLIERRHMSEAQAHRFIEKQAMDKRLTRREVAEEILRTDGA